MYGPRSSVTSALLSFLSRVTWRSRWNRGLRWSAGSGRPLSSDIPVLTAPFVRRKLALVPALDGEATYSVNVRGRREPLDGLIRLSGMEVSSDGTDESVRPAGSCRSGATAGCL